MAVTDDLNILAMLRESVTKKKSKSYGHWTVFVDTVFARSCQVLNVTALHSKELKIVICLVENDSSVETQYLVG